jgi:hypothetical protein
MGKQIKSKAQFPNKKTFSLLIVMGKLIKSNAHFPAKNITDSQWKADKAKRAFSDKNVFCSDSRRIHADTVLGKKHAYNI